MYVETELLKQLGRNIKAERVRKGYTQESFAEIIGVSREYISRIERGQENMSVLRILKIANNLKTDINNLLRF
ncbi:helix-turn-helix transcriptional regulator [bacterium]|nr:helix-turn-helix transcriptional regulator [bacterium]